MVPKWLQKWSQNGSENDIENDLKKDTKKELFHKPELARTGKRVNEDHVHTRASSFGTCLSLMEPAQTHPKLILVPFWLAEAHFGTIWSVLLGSFWGHFGLLGSRAGFGHFGSPFCAF